MSICGYCSQRGTPPCAKCLRPETCTCDRADHAAKVAAATRGNVQVSGGDSHVCSVNWPGQNEAPAAYLDGPRTGASHRSTLAKKETG